MCCAGAEGIPEQLALAGSDSFTAMLTAALEGYSRSAVGWQPVESSIYNGGFQLLGLLTPHLLFCKLYCAWRLCC